MLRSYNPNALSHGARSDKENRNSQFPKTPGIQKTPGIRSKTPGMSLAKTPGIKLSMTANTQKTPMLSKQAGKQSEAGTVLGGKGTVVSLHRPLLRDITNKTPAPSRHRQRTGSSTKKSAGRINGEAIKTPALNGFGQPPELTTAKKIPVLLEQDNDIENDVQLELNSEIQLQEDIDLPDIEYMAPRAQELPYDPGFELVDASIFARVVPDYNAYASELGLDEQPETVPEFIPEPIISPFTLGKKQTTNVTDKKPLSGSMKGNVERRIKTTTVGANGRQPTKQVSKMPTKSARSISKNTPVLKHSNVRAAASEAVETYFAKPTRNVKEEFDIDALLEEARKL